MNKAMTEPSPAELKKSIQELTAYRDRLHQEVTTIAKKLQMPPKKIALTLEGNFELKQIENILNVLKKQLQEKDKTDH